MSEEREKQLWELTLPAAIELVDSRKEVACQLLGIDSGQYWRLLRLIGEDEISKLIDGVRVEMIEADAALKLLKLEEAG